VTAWLTAWTSEPVIGASLLIAAGLYGAGIRTLWRRAGYGKGVRPWQAASFALGIAVLIVALLSPLAELSEQLLSAHMTQHELLMLVAAPLLVFGQPLLVWLWALPVQWRDRTGRAVHTRGVAALWGWLTAPLVVFAIHGAALWIWHLPALYQAALEHEPVHALQHVCFLLAATLFWWGMMYGRYGRLGYGVAVTYVFLTVMHTGLLGALMVMAPSLWYPDYAGPAAQAHADPLADQQLAGLIMWIPSGVILMVLGLALFAAWMGQSAKRTAIAEAATGGLKPAPTRVD
jgi:cytochrome c oxidase assembly factor CtaG